MNRLDELVRTELHAQAEAHPVPAGLADRAIAGGRRRRLRWRVPVAAVAAAVLAGTGGLIAQSAGSDGYRSVVYATHTRIGATWRILDPTTGRYRSVAGLGRISAPSTDLRYAVVTPPSTTKQPVTRLGRYDGWTGEIRWYDSPIDLDGAAISPDGRYAMASGSSLATGDEVVFVDLTDGSVTSTPMSEPLARHWPLQWLADSRHFAMGTAIMDLAGRRTGTLPASDTWEVQAVRPDGSGLLVRPQNAGNRYALADERGRLSKPVTVSGCLTPPPTASPGAQPVSDCLWPTYLGWRGGDRILLAVHDYGRAPGDDYGHTVVDVDLRTGARQELDVYDGPPIDEIMVAPAPGGRQPFPTF
jgi:hypothetical protein